LFNIQEITMKNLNVSKLNVLLATAACLAAGSAQAQQWDPATFQKSTEMMIPHQLVPTILGPSGRMPAAAVTPVDADDRRAADAIRRTDMMMPEMAQSQPSRDPHTLTAMPGVQRPASPQDADDRRMAESIRRTDQMRPD
jgi:hypothetical protein